jgi:hypothetical protein
MPLLPQEVPAPPLRFDRRGGGLAITAGSVLDMPADAAPQMLYALSSMRFRSDGTELVGGRPELKPTSIHSADRRTEM